MQERVRIGRIEARLARLRFPSRIFLRFIGVFGLVGYGTYCLLPICTDAHDMFFTVPIERILIGALCLISGLASIHCSFAYLRFQSRIRSKLPCK